VEGFCQASFARKRESSSFRSALRGLECGSLLAVHCTREARASSRKRSGSKLPHSGVPVSS
jgi:hypothetical protein